MKLPKIDLRETATLFSLQNMRSQGYFSWGQDTV